MKPISLRFSRTASMTPCELTITEPDLTRSDDRHVITPRNRGAAHDPGQAGGRAAD